MDTGLQYGMTRTVKADSVLGGDCRFDGVTHTINSVLWEIVERVRIVRRNNDHSKNVDARLLFGRR